MKIKDNDDNEINTKNVKTGNYFKESVIEGLKIKIKKISNVNTPESSRKFVDIQAQLKKQNKQIIKTKEGFHDYYYNLKKKRHYLFDISFCLLYKYRICPSRLSKNEEFLMNLFIKSQNIIVKKMDVVEYLKFLFEYVNLKFVLFNDMNALCLQFANKPKLINSKEDKLSKKKVEKIEEIVRHFTRKNGDLSGEENKLYEILSDDVKELINAFK